MRIYLISGEASGDLHGANLIKALKKIYPQLEIRAWGGDLIKNEGAHLVKHYRNLAFMGFFEVVKNLRTILKNIEFCKKDILTFKPDALILIDYPGFNLRIAEFAHHHHIPVIYYISPQVWAWKQNRVYKIKRTVDLMLCILPFEEAFYKQFNYTTFFVGHPLLDAIEDFKCNNLLNKETFLKQYNLANKPIIALLPGSRKQEIEVKLTIMQKVIKHFPEYQFVVAAAPSVEKNFYCKFLLPDVKLIENATYPLLNFASAALVTSGTATLETALFKVPQVVCYKGSAVSYFIAKQLVKVNYISLVNLIMNKKIVTELIQNELNEENLKKELSLILPGGSNRNEMLKNYDLLYQTLGNKGASENAANKIFEFLNKK